MFRFADDLLQNFYRPLGLEPAFSALGVESYQILLWSPSCALSPAVFGRFCGSHVHTDIESQGPIGRYRGPQLEMEMEGRWPTWNGLMSSAVASLGLRSAITPGHENCFHRRAVALVPEMYRLALLLRTAGGRDPSHPSVQGLALVSYPATLEYDIDPIRDFLGPWPDLLATDVPQCIFVLEDGYPVVALRGNGLALLGDGSEIDVLALLRSGLQLVEIADVVRRSSGLPGPHIKRSTPGFARLRPLINPVPIPPPDSTWSSQQVERLADWQSQRLLDQPWSCVMRDGRLHVLRESTGQPMFEAGFVETSMGWRVADLSVNSDQITELVTVGAASEFLNVMEQLVAEQHDRTDPAA